MMRIGLAGLFVVSMFTALPAHALDCGTRLREVHQNPQGLTPGASFILEGEDVVVPGTADAAERICRTVDERKAFKAQNVAEKAALIASNKKLAKELDDFQNMNPFQVHYKALGLAAVVELLMLTFLFGRWSARWKTTAGIRR